MAQANGSGRNTTVLLPAVIAGLIAAIFAVDLWLPKGTSEWALYLIPLLLTMWLPSQRLPLLIASTITVLALAGFIYSPEGVPLWISLLNRTFGFLVMWGTAALLIRYKRSEAALTRSEARFCQMADAMQEVFWMAEPSMLGASYVSPAYETLWGRTRESLYRNPVSWLDAVHPEDRDRVLTALQRYRIARSEVEYRIVRPDGSVRWVWDRGYPMLDERNQLTGVAGIAQDITERKAAEEALAEQTRFLRAILDSVGDGVIVTDRHGKFMLFNRRAVELHGGLSAGDIPPEQWATHYGLYLPDGVTPYPANALPMARSMRGEVVDNVEMCIRTPGHPEGRWVLVTGRPVIDDRGTLRGGVIVRRDITARRIAERPQTAYYAATQILAESAQLGDTLPKILKVLCQSLDWDMGIYWTLSSRDNLLRCELIWSKPGAGFPGFEAISRRMELAKGVELPGRVWANGEAAWVPDLLRETRFTRTIVAAEEGLQNVLIVPVRWEQTTIGVFELFSRSPRAVDQDLLHMLGLLGSQIGLFAMRKRGEEERERLLSQLQEALSRVKTLRGLLPICSCCQKVRDDAGRWKELEAYVKAHSEADFTQDLCPVCADTLFPNFSRSREKKGPDH